MLGDRRGGLASPTAVSIPSKNGQRPDAGGRQWRSRPGPGRTQLGLPRRGANIVVLLGDGRGGFAPPRSQRRSTPGGVALGRLNADRNPDIALTTGAVVRLLFGNGRGGFRPGPRYRLRGYVGLGAIADFDRDGAQDLALTTSRPGVRLLLGDGRGSFSRPRRFALPGCGQTPCTGRRWLSGGWTGTADPTSSSAATTSAGRPRQMPARWSGCS